MSRPVSLHTWVERSRPQIIFFLTMLRQHSQYDSRLGFSFRVLLRVRVRLWLGLGLGLVLGLWLQWRIHSWSQGGFPKVTHLRGW